MPVTASNLIQGPAELWCAPFGSTEPLDSVLTAAPTTPWINLGATDGGVKVTVTQTYNAMTVDQVVEPVDHRLVMRAVTVATNLAEPTLANLMRVLNATTDTPTVSTGIASYELPTGSSATQPTSRALIIDGYAPAGFRRRIFVRKALVIDSVETTSKKDAQTYFAIQWKGQYVSPSIGSCRWLDQTA
jgi:hypothetical protein